MGCLVGPSNDGMRRAKHNPHRYQERGLSTDVIRLTDTRRADGGLSHPMKMKSVSLQQATEPYPL